MFLFCRNLSSSPASPGVTQQTLHLWSIITLALLVLSGYQGLGAGVWQMLGGPRSSTGLCCRLAPLPLGPCEALTTVGVSAGLLLVLGRVPVAPAIALCCVAHLSCCTFETLCTGPSHNRTGFLGDLCHGCSPSPPPRGSHWL